MRLHKHTSWLMLMVVVVSACSFAPTTPSATPTPEAVLKLRIADGVSPPAALPQSILPNSSDVIKLQAQKTLEVRVIGSPNGRNFWMIVSLGITEEQKRKILWDNGARLFGLQSATEAPLLTV